MIWHKDLFVGETLKKKQKKICRYVEKRKVVPELYLILIRPKARANQLEFMTQSYFYKSDLEKENPVILGIAFGKSEGKQLLVEMTDRVYRETGKAQLKEYYLANCL